MTPQEWQRCARAWISLWNPTEFVPDVWTPENDEEEQDAVEVA
jgi:hypothetical protein